MATVIKRVDELGRFHIPARYRRQLAIDTDDSVVIKFAQSELSIKKYQATFNVEKFIKQFVVVKYGSKYRDILVTNKMKSDVCELLHDYFDTQIKYGKEE